MNENNGVEEGEGLDPNSLSVPDNASVRSADSPPANADTERASTTEAISSSAGLDPMKVDAEQRQEDAPQDEASIVQVHDYAGPHPPAAMLTDSLEKSDVVKRIKLQNGPEIIDQSAGPDLPLSAAVDPPQDSSIAKKIAQSAAESHLESPTDLSPPIPFHCAEHEDDQARIEAIMSEIESIAICRSLTSGVWFVRENPKTGASPRSRARRRGGKWLPVTLREHASENWQKLKNFDFYLIPSRRGGEAGVEYLNSHDAFEEDEDEESPQAGTGIFLEAGNVARIDPSSADAGRHLPDQTGNDSMPVIPEAFLVPEDNIGIVAAEPLLPWWKQPRTVSSVICLMLVAAVIAVGITLVSGSSPIAVIGTVELRRSLAPSLSSAPSLSTAPSASPTACFQIEIAVTLFDVDYPTRQAWELSRIDSVGGVEKIKSYKGYNEDASHSESMCLPKGQYEFAIRFETEHDGGGGVCCEGQYSITSNGEAIVRGDEFWQQYLGVTSGFRIPHVSSSSSSSKAPAVVASPSPQPSITPS